MCVCWGRGGWVGACLYACWGDSVSARMFVFQCVSVSLNFVWLSMRSNLWLCYWFLWEYLCSPWFCLIKSQRIMRHQICTINSMCVGMCRETWEYVCVRLHIHPNLHTYSVCVCMCVCVCVCVQATLWVQGLINSMCVHGHVHENLWMCVCASGYTSILIYRYTVYACVWVCMCVCENKQQWLGVILESVPIAVSCFVTETKSQMFCKFPGFYSTSGYMSIIFSAHLVTMKWEVFTTTSTREIQLCTRPATQLTCSPLLLANHACQSIVHAWRFKWKGFIILCFCLTQGSTFFFLLFFKGRVTNQQTHSQSLWSKN